MHEYSLVLGLIEQASEHVAEHRARGVRRLVVRVGELSGVVPELLETAFEVAREKTVCEHAELVLERVAARWECPRCGRAVPAGAVLVCEPCGVSATLVEGEELHLMSLELEVTRDV